MENTSVSRGAKAAPTDYRCVTFTVVPASADVCDLLADGLAEIGFESFDHDDEGSSMMAYVQENLFDAAAVDTAVAEVDIPADITWTSEFVAGQDWNSEWEKNYFRPIVVDGLVAVHSSFHTDVPQARHDIVIDPRMAFGTGHHATTTLMMRFLLHADVAGKKVLDMGTGTGILAILASMLGASEAVGIEIDPFAAENAVDNVALNLPDNKGVEIICGDASALAGREEWADIFLANINRNIITADVAAYAAAMKHGALLTVSGFYVSDRDVVAAAARQAGLEPAGVAEQDGWSSMTFVKP